jgi:hypothetical protein
MSNSTHCTHCTCSSHYWTVMQCVSLYTSTLRCAQLLLLLLLLLTYHYYCCCLSHMLQADPKRVAAASASFSSMTSLGDTPPDTVQACMRPCPPDSLPIMGAVEGITGAYIAAGHNCWVCVHVYCKNSLLVIACTASGSDGL